MVTTDVLNNLGKTVHYKNERYFIDADYIHIKYTVRLHKGKARLQDMCKNSVIIVPLREVEKNESKQ